MKNYVSFIALLFAFTFVSISVSAQAVASPMQSTADYLGRQIMYDSMTMNNMMRDTRSAVKSGGGLSAKSGGASGSASANANRRTPGSPANKKAARASVTFTSTGSFIALGKLAKKMSSSPEDERETEANFINGVTFFNKALKENGYPTNDLAHATTALFVNCFVVHSGKSVTQRQRNGIYSAFKEYLETSEHFQSLTNRQKQENYELTGLMWATVYVTDSVAKEKGDKASRKRAKDTAKTMMEEFIGANIDSIRLTDDGFDVIQ